MTESPRPQLKSWLSGLQEKLRLDSKRRFMLLLVFFNGLLIVILLLSVRNQEIRRRIKRVEERITYLVTQLATIEANEVRIVRITATPVGTSTPGAVAAVTPTPLSTATVFPTATRRPTHTPTPTLTQTQTPTLTPSHTPTPTLTWTPTSTPSHTPTPTPSHTPTPTDTPTWTPSPNPPPELSRIVLSTSDSSIIADGSSTSDIRADLYDQFGAPFLEEAQLTFSTNKGSFWGAPTVSTRVRGGSVKVPLTSSTSVGVATIGAWAGSVADQTTVAFVPGPPYSLVLTASPVRPPVGEAATIEAVVQDAFGNQVADGTRVQFETTFGVLERREAGTRQGVVNTTLSSNTPGQATVTAEAGQAAGMVLVEFISRLSLVQVTPASGCNETEVGITIGGSGFTPDTSVALENWAMDSSWINASTLQATVPQDIAAGAYDLIARNPGGDRATLANAYRALDCGPIDTPLDRGYLGMSGAEPGFSSSQGDDDQVQVLFFEVPEATPGPFYVRLFDPDCSGEHDIQNGKAWDTPFTFTLYGGPGAYTEPDARSSHPTDGASVGSQLAVVKSDDINSDAQWYNLGPIAATDGELVNGKRLFKLTVIGGPTPPFASGLHFADLNAYSVVLSTSDVRNVPVAESRILAFSWTFLIPGDANGASPRVYPYVGPNTRTVVQHNWDYDRFTENAGVNIVTPQRTINASYDKVSGDDEEKSSAHAVQDTERDTTWALRYWAETTQDVADNLVTLWATDQDGRALPVFARSTNRSPP